MHDVLSARAKSDNKVAAEYMNGTPKSQSSYLVRTRVTYRQPRLDRTEAGRNEEQRSRTLTVLVFVRRAEGCQ